MDQDDDLRLSTPGLTRPQPRTRASLVNPGSGRNSAPRTPRSKPVGARGTRGGLIRQDIKPNRAARNNAPVANKIGNRPSAARSQLSSLSSQLAPKQQPSGITPQIQTLLPQQAEQPKLAPTARPQARPQAAQTQRTGANGLTVPDGAIEILRGNFSAGSGSITPSFRRSFAVDDGTGRGGYTEIGAPLAPIVQSQVQSAAENVGTPQGLVDSANLNAIAPQTGQLVNNNLGQERQIQAQQEAQRLQIASQQQRAQQEAQLRIQAQQAQASAPQIMTIKDDQGAEQLVRFDPATGTQSRVLTPEQEQLNKTIATKRRELQTKYPNDTPEKIEEYLQKKYGQE